MIQIRGFQVDCRSPTLRSLIVENWKLGEAEGSFLFLFGVSGLFRLVYYLPLDQVVYCQISVLQLLCHSFNWVWKVSQVFLLKLDGMLRRLLFISETFESSMRGIDLVLECLDIGGLLLRLVIFIDDAIWLLLLASIELFVCPHCFHITNASIMSSEVR